MKEKSLKFTSDDWVQAYEENVRKVIKWSGFKVKSTKIFNGMYLKYKDCNPYTFMSANFPPYRKWTASNKQGKWKSIKYPLPYMLFNANSIKHYNRFMNQGLINIPSKREAIINGVKASLKRLKQVGVNLNDFQRVWDMYILKYASPYILLLSKDMMFWINQAVRKRSINLEEQAVLVKYKKTLDSYNGLNIELNKIIKENYEK